MSPFEPAIRAILKHEDTEGYSDTLLDLFILDRKTHWADIAESLRDKTWVVSDRWHYSTMVYQNIHADIEVSDIETRLLELAPHADLTIAIDMSTEIAGGRMAARQRDGFEKDGGLQRAVRQLYLGLARVKTGLVVVSGNGCAEDVHQRVWDAVVARFPDA
jgi:thymidylate kinase